MKKSVICLMVGLMVGVSGVGADDKVDAQAQSVLDAAAALFKAANHDGAKSAYTKVIKDFPAARKTILASAQMGIGSCEWGQLNRVEAQAAWQLALDTYSDAMTDMTKVSAIYHVGHALLAQEKASAALAKFESILTTYPSVSEDSTARTKIAKGVCLEKLGRTAEAQEMYKSTVLDHVWNLGAGTNQSGVIWSAFNKIKPASITSSDYQSFLKSARQATKGIPSNADFLGRLQSESEK